MEEILNISSEEELLQLRNEGKISEVEYQDLLSAMRKTSSSEPEIPQPQAEQSRSKRKMGKTAFVLMLIGLILPAVLYWLMETTAQAHNSNAHASIAPWFFLGIAFEIAAFVKGVISWPDVFGKATVVTVSILTLLLILFTA